MVLLYQNDPSKRLCFIFDLIVSLLTGTFINSLMVNQKLAEWVLSFFPIHWLWLYFIKMPLPNGYGGCRMTEGLLIWQEWKNKNIYAVDKCMKINKWAVWGVLFWDRRNFFPPPLFGLRAASYKVHDCFCGILRVMTNWLLGTEREKKVVVGGELKMSADW